MGVSMRIELVHKGRFLSENENDRFEEYAFMIWFEIVDPC